MNVHQNVSFVPRKFVGRALQAYVLYLRYLGSESRVLGQGVLCMDKRVAVCFSGWLRVSIPAAGLTARRFLVDALQADTFLAGSNVSPFIPHTLFT